MTGDRSESGDPQTRKLDRRSVFYLLGAYISGIFSAIVGLLYAVPDAEDEYGTEDIPDYKSADITSLDVEPNSVYVDEYSRLSVQAEYETGQEADEYTIPSVQIADLVKGEMTPMLNGETKQPGTTGTYEMSFVNLGEDIEPTTIAVIMGDKVDNFEVVER